MEENEKNGARIKILGSAAAYIAYGALSGGARQTVHGLTVLGVSQVAANKEAIEETRPKVGALSLARHPLHTVVVPPRELDRRLLRGAVHGDVADLEQLHAAHLHFEANGAAHRKSRRGHALQLHRVWC